MKQTFATYEHSTLGFPKVVLKWHVDNNQLASTYLVVKGSIFCLGWAWYNPNPLAFMDFELKRFDDWVRQKYGNDASVQG